jgi:hypothetical protein
MKEIREFLDRAMSTQIAEQMKIGLDLVEGIDRATGTVYRSN